MIEKKALDAIKILGVEAINNANSGHPGIVLGAAPIVFSLFKDHLNINVENEKWINRDRFILSAGHGSAMLYAINHLVGYDISIDDLKRFRRIGNTPGHPEYGHTSGVETTSGPLGQGIANAVGIAIAESHLSKRFNVDNFDIINHYTYVLVGDGDLQEGVALEAISLAGHLKLGKLIVLFDSNDIQLDGPVNLTYSEKHKKKFESLNWHYIYVEDGSDINSISKAIAKAKKISDKPSIIEVKTVIGSGASKAGTSSIHGSPLGDDIFNLKENLNWKNDPFEIDKDIYDFYLKNVKNRGIKKYNSWVNKYEKYSILEKEKFNLLNKFINDDFNVTLNDILEKMTIKPKSATRNLSGEVLNILSNQYLNLIGGSADLTSSTKAKGLDGNYSFENQKGRNINYGVREHAMGAIANGIVLHGGLKSFTGAFFVFSDYMKPAIRLAAIMKIPTIFIFSHDSIAVGEDGPTHQPIEQLVGLRAIPNLNVIRPADANETVAALKIAIESKNIPTTIVLTRQNVKNFTTTSYEKTLKGAYIVDSEKEKLDGIIIASGSEVELAISVKEELLKKNIDVRVVSMPSHYLFEKQNEEYKNNILPKGIKTIAVEMASPLSWYKYTPYVYGIEQFGLSDKGEKVVEIMGFTKEKICKFFEEIR